MSKLAYNPWIVPADLLDGAKSVSDVCSYVEHEWSGCQAKKTKLLEDDIHSVSPISEAMLEKSWKQNLQRGVTWAMALQTFDQESQRFAKPACGEEFPKKVLYQSSCGAFCRSCHDMNLVKFYQSLLDAFAELVKSIGDISRASKEHILLQCTVRFEVEEKQVFAWLVAPAASSGVNRCDQTFVLCNVAGPMGEVPSLSLRTFCFCPCNTLFYIIFYYIILYFMILYDIIWYYMIWYYIIFVFINLCTCKNMRL